jgi:hypothetical protein
VISHLLFITNFACAVLGVGPHRDQPVMFRRVRTPVTGA